METKYSKFMKELWELTGKIGSYAESKNDNRYNKVYDYLNKALDEAEAAGLIEHEMDEFDYFND